MSNIEGLAANGNVQDMDGQVLAERDARYKNIDAAAEFAGTLSLGTSVVVERGARLGPDCTLDDDSEVGEGAYLASGVYVGESATVDPDAYLEQGVHVGRWAIVGRGTLIAAGVEVPGDADIGTDRVIPGQDMLQRVGPLGPSDLYLTIYAGDHGPYINVEASEMTLEEFERHMADPDTRAIEKIAPDIVAAIRMLAMADQARYNLAVANGTVATLRARKAALMNP